MLAQATRPINETSALGIGCYTVPEVARLIKTPRRNIMRWLAGYSFQSGGRRRRMTPLWRPELPANDDGKLELGFRDLIELRFVEAFIAEGLDLRIVRRCLERAQTSLANERPFSTRRFKTDGRTIFQETLTELGETQLLDLRQGQYVIKTVLERTFRDLDFDGEIVSRWRPFQGRETIVLDPNRAFGQPIVSCTGTPTSVLNDAVKAEGSMERVAWIFEIPPPTVKDAVRFEHSLRTA